MRRVIVNDNAWTANNKNNSSNNNNSNNNSDNYNNNDDNVIIIIIIITVINNTTFIFITLSSCIIINKDTPHVKFHYLVSLFLLRCSVVLFNLPLTNTYKTKVFVVLLCSIRQLYIQEQGVLYYSSVVLDNIVSEQKIQYANSISNTGNLRFLKMYNILY